MYLAFGFHRRTDDLRAGVGGQRGQGIHSKWVRDHKEQLRQSQDAERDPSHSPEEVATKLQGLGLSGDDESPTAPGGPKRSTTGTEHSSSGSTTSSMLVRYFPQRYFILKSLTQVRTWRFLIFRPQFLLLIFRFSSSILTSAFNKGYGQHSATTKVFWTRHSGPARMYFSSSESTKVASFTAMRGKLPSSLPVYSAGRLTSSLSEWQDPFHEVNTVCHGPLLRLQSRLAQSLASALQCSVECRTNSTAGGQKAATSFLRTNIVLMSRLCPSPVRRINLHLHLAPNNIPLSRRINKGRSSLRRRSCATPIAS